jgi:hypothetical protein
MSYRQVKLAITEVEPGYPLGKKVLEFFHHGERRPEAHSTPSSHGVSTKDALLGATPFCFYTHHRSHLLVSPVVKEPAAR